MSGDNMELVNSRSIINKNALQSISNKDYATKYRGNQPWVEGVANKDISNLISKRPIAREIFLSQSGYKELIQRVGQALASNDLASSDTMQQTFFDLASFVKADLTPAMIKGNGMVNTILEECKVEIQDKSQKTKTARDILNYMMYGQAGLAAVDVINQNKEKPMTATEAIAHFADVKVDPTLQSTQRRMNIKFKDQ